MLIYVLLHVKKRARRCLAGLPSWSPGNCSFLGIVMLLEILDDFSGELVPMVNHCRINSASVVNMSNAVESREVVLAGVLIGVIIVSHMQ